MLYIPSVLCNPLTVTAKKKKKTTTDSIMIYFLYCHKSSDKTQLCIYFQQYNDIFFITVLINPNFVDR